MLFLAGVGVSASCSAGSGGVRQPDVETRVIVNGWSKVLGIIWLKVTHGPAQVMSPELSRSTKPLFSTSEDNGGDQGYSAVTGTKRQTP